MKKFKFTLQTVHNVRELREEKEKLLFSQLQADASKAALRVAEIEIMRSEAIDNYAQRLKSGEQLNAVEMELNLNHFAALNRLQQEAEKVLEQKKQACQRQSTAVAAAMREVKITNRLRETQQERYKNEFERQEQNNLDELVSANFARQIPQTR